MAKKPPKSWTSYQPQNQAKLGQQLIAGAALAKGVVRPSVPAPALAGPTPYDGNAAANASSNPLLEAQYNNTTGDNQAAFNIATGEATYQEDTTGKDYGYNIARDASGNVDYNATLAGGVDPNNPFSKMMMLQRAYQGQQRGTTNSYAAQGQLYSGAVANQRADDKFNNNYNVDQTTKAFAADLHGQGLNRQNAGLALRTGNTAAAGNRLNSYLSGS